MRISAHGSREVGIFSSSSLVKFVVVPIALVSTIGDSPVTVTDSCTLATFIVKVRSNVVPTETMRFSRMTVEKPARSVVSR